MEKYFFSNLPWVHMFWDSATSLSMAALVATSLIILYLWFQQKASRPFSTDMPSTLTTSKAGPMPQLPQDVVAYKRTKSFVNDTIPKGLLKRHTTAVGVWGKLHIEQGKLRYHILPEGQQEEREFVLEAGSDQCVGIIEPQAPHQVELMGDDEPVQFYVEFLKRPSSHPAAQPTTAYEM